MDSEFTYWRHGTPVGVKIEEIGGGAGRHGRVWEILARQIWCENGRGGEYRVLDHTEAGAPLLEGGAERVSVSHTEGLMVVAWLPATPEVDLGVYTRRAALGVDVERRDRAKACDLASRFLGDEEQELTAVDGRQDVERCITAWCCKEAMYKAALTPGLDWRGDIRVERLPDAATGALGAGSVKLNADAPAEPFMLYAFHGGEEAEFMVVLALSPQSATFKKTVGQENAKAKE